MTQLVAELTVMGEPRSKGRPRVTRNGTYTPPLTREHTKRVREQFLALTLPDYPKDAVFRMDCDFYLGTRRHVDSDNLLKLIKDAYNVVAFDDDWQVYDTRTRKYHTSRDRARTVIRLYIIDPDRQEQT